MTTPEDLGKLCRRGSQSFELLLNQDLGVAAIYFKAFHERFHKTIFTVLPGPRFKRIWTNGAITTTLKEPSRVKCAAAACRWSPYWMANRFGWRKTLS